jgi:TolB-like protein/DNA-binding winged helix-turn-helix (wHTH) protein/Flp pilus assembly protein TadD
LNANFIEDILGDLEARVESSGQAPRGFRFGLFEVDLRSGELRKSGVKLKLPGQPLQVLAALVERPGEVVTRDELRNKLWDADTFVDVDHSLANAVKKIREVLGDSADSPRYIETLPKRGYRFLAPVTALESASPALASPTIDIPLEAPLPGGQPRSMGRRSFMHVAAAGAAVATGAGALAAGFNVAGSRDWLRWKLMPPRIESIAVLPLDNISGDSQQDYFADGMTDALITGLGQVSALRVISRTSVMGYKGTKKSLPEIARELNVDSIVEGTVLRSGERVRITAQLLYAPTDRHLWAQSYDRDLRDILELQSEVARAIASEVVAKLNSEQSRLANTRTVPPAAYEAYTKGAFGPSAEAIESFEQAIKLDPNYALAYAGLADRYYTLGLFGGLAPDLAYARMKDAALKALESDEALPKAYGLLGSVRLHHDWDWKESERAFHRALTLNPNDADARHGYSHFLLAMSRNEESLAETQKALDLDPLNATLIACMGWHVLYASQYDKAVNYAGRALQISPKNFWAELVIGWADEQRGRFPEAIAAFEKAIDFSRGRAITVASLGHALAASGRTREAQRVLAKLKEQSQRTYVPAYEMAAVYNGLGERDQAFAMLGKAYQERSSFLVHVGWDPRFRNLHGDSRFQDLLRRIGLPS